LVAYLFSGYRARKLKPEAKINLLSVYIDVMKKKRVVKKLVF